MKSGDSLIDRIFEEGIKDANAFIIVLSKNSVNKPWVRKELTQNYITGCPKFCFKTEIGLKMNGTLFCRDE
ncbi:toll/interleukin-1 receptor domain-containing protein [Leptospira santarosai]|uniref:toll/interleukin-1 receptor domain-containing protein n=1 Tax=Leptospira santarosai TaxID=28183 RepID=UPI0003748D70|nr:toll/interleukin-1 receptor domain-containing protein [Leptospira santarosai]